MLLQLLENDSNLLNSILPEGLETAGVHQVAQQVLNEIHNVTKRSISFKYSSKPQNSVRERKFVSCLGNIDRFRGPSAVIQIWSVSSS